MVRGHEISFLDSIMELVLLSAFQVYESGFKSEVLVKPNERKRGLGRFDSDIIRYHPRPQSYRIKI